MEGRTAAPGPIRGPPAPDKTFSLQLDLESDLRLGLFGGATKSGRPPLRRDNRDKDERQGSGHENVSPFRSAGESRRGRSAREAYLQLIRTLHSYFWVPISLIRATGSMTPRRCGHRRADNSSLREKWQGSCLGGPFPYPTWLCQDSVRSTGAWAVRGLLRSLTSDHGVFLSGQTGFCSLTFCIAPVVVNLMLRGFHGFGVGSS